jgi:AAA domain
MAPDGGSSKAGSATPSQQLEKDAAAVAARLRLFAEPGQVVELRALGVEQQYGRPQTVAGFFDDPLAMAKEALRLTRRAEGVYFTLNPVDPALKARRNKNNRTSLSETGDLANDGNVLCRRWLLIDPDPVRVAKVSSSDAEKRRGEEVTLAIRDWLREDRGWPGPVFADSGNSYHLLYRVELPKDDGDLVKRVLKALAARFDCDEVKIDQSVFNPARICKLYGTMARKGESLPERPHRQARVIEVPGCADCSDLSGAMLAPVSRELLEELAAEAREAPKAQSNGARLDGDGEFRHRLKVGEWLDARGVAYQKKPAGGRWQDKYLLDACPFNPDHTGKEVAIFQAADGKLGAKCFHNSCGGNGWQEFKARIGKPSPEHYDPPLSSNGQKGEQDPEAAGQPPEQPSYAFEVIDSPTFARADYRLEWLVRRLLVRGQPVLLGGPRKSLKTSLVVDLVLSLGSGTPFLGSEDFRVNRPVRTAILSGESGEATLQETARRVCAAKGIDLAAVDVLWGFRLPQLASADQCGALAEGLQRHKVEVLVIDPIYLCLLAGAEGKGVDAANLFQMGPLLMAVTQTCLDVGCTPSLIHHTRKNLNAPFDPLELEDLAFAGVQEFARQWLLVNRREKYEPGTGLHKLWLNAGGSAGQSGLWGVDIGEGVIDDNFAGRRWEVTVHTGTQARQAKRDTRAEEKRQKQAEQEQQDDTALLAALDQLDPKHKGASYNQVQGAAGLSEGRMLRAFLRLKKAKVVKDASVVVKIGSKAKRAVKGLKRCPDT